MDRVLAISKAVNQEYACSMVNRYNAIMDSLAYITPYLVALNVSVTISCQLIQTVNEYLHLIGVPVR